MNSLVRGCPQSRVRKTRNDFSGGSANTLPLPVSRRTGVPQSHHPSILCGRNSHISFHINHRNVTLARRQALLSNQTMNIAMNRGDFCSFIFGGAVFTFENKFANIGRGWVCDSLASGAVGLWRSVTLIVGSGGYPQIFQSKTCYLSSLIFAIC